MNKYCRFVRENVDRRVVLEQLAEEAAELSQAALKMIRAFGMAYNPTPVTPDQAFDQLTEELGDVLMCASLVMSPARIEKLTGGIYTNPKWKRWAKRITASW